MTSVAGPAMTHECVRCNRWRGTATGARIRALVSSCAGDQRHGTVTSALIRALVTSGAGDTRALIRALVSSGAAPPPAYEFVCW